MLVAGDPAGRPDRPGQRVSHRLPWPSTLADHVMGLADEPAGLVAVWRPGEPRIAVRRVPLPRSGHDGGFRFVLR
jgi:hypothetical protein